MFDIFKNGKWFQIVFPMVFFALLICSLSLLGCSNEKSANLIIAHGGQDQVYDTTMSNLKTEFEILDDRSLVEASGEDYGDAVFQITSGAADFAVLGADIVVAAQEGNLSKYGCDSASEKKRFGNVSAIGREYVQFATLDKSLEELSDMSDVKISVAKGDVRAENIVSDIVDILDLEKVDIVECEDGSLGNELLARKADVAVVVSDTASRELGEATASTDFHLIDLGESAKGKIMGIQYAETSKPPLLLYTGMDDIEAVSVPVVLVAAEDCDDVCVDNMTSASVACVENAHVFDNVLETCTNLPGDYHKGTESFYKGKDIEVMVSREQ